MVMMLAKKPKYLNYQRIYSRRGRMKSMLFFFMLRITFNAQTELPANFKIKIADLGNACWIHHHFSTLIQTR